MVIFFKCKNSINIHKRNTIKINAKLMTPELLIYWCIYKVLNYHLGRRYGKWVIKIWFSWQNSFFQYNEELQYKPIFFNYRFYSSLLSVLRTKSPHCDSPKGYQNQKPHWWNKVRYELANKDVYQCSPLTCPLPVPKIYLLKWF